MGCFSFLCPCFQSASARRDTRPQKQAKEGLQHLAKGYREIAKLELPAGTASVIADVRRSIIEIEKILHDVKMPKPRQWLLHLPQEQADWEALFPEGGFLLRTQMCMGSVRDDEWVVGCLFISDFGIAFDSGPIAGESAVETGFVPWQDISSLIHAEPGAANPRGLITASIGGFRGFSSLDLQLSIPGDAEWLLEFWKRRHGGARHAPVKGGHNEDWSVPESEERVQVPPPTKEVRLICPPVQRERAMSPRVQREQSQPPFSPPVKEEVGHPHLERSRLSIAARRSLSDLSSTLPDSPKGTPAAEAPKQAPTNVEKHDALSKEVVVKALETQDCLVRFVREQLNGTEVSDVPWSKSRRVRDTLVRKITFRMKLPDDVPRIVKKLISIPESTSVTLLSRLRIDATGAFLTYQTCTHDVTFGENFRVQETLAFLPTSGGGVELKRWAEVVWVTPLPWAMGAVKSYIEGRAKADGVKNVAALARIIKELGQ